MCDWKSIFAPQENGQLWSMVSRVLLVVTFDIEQCMFKLSMKSNAINAMAKPIDVNHVFCLWCTLLTFKVFSSFSKYFKLTKIAMVQIIGVEDECYFNSLAFCKSKLQNSNNLNTYLINLKLNC